MLVRGLARTPAQALAVQAPLPRAAPACVRPARSLYDDHRTRLRAAAPLSGPPVPQVPALRLPRLRRAGGANRDGPPGAGRRGKVDRESALQPPAGGDAGA